ncbi:hypothetical protein JTB14_032879 [Gonioctena quinquepunctata]|nr:hypothetical protein JTB14_032879 [Gonioctena quinquepunctata]
MPDTQPQVVNVTTPVSVSPPEKFLFSSPGTSTTWRKRFERNIIYERFKFHSTIQKPGEPIESFIKNLHSVAEHCNYGTLKEEFIRDRIVVGMLDTKTSERLQLKEQLDLKECILIVKQAELQASQNKELYNTSRLVNRVQYSSQSPRSEGSLRPRSEGSQRPRSEGFQRERMNVGTGDKCGFCGLRSHPRDQCPAGKSKCRKCEKSGHWATVCRSSKDLVDTLKDNVMRKFPRIFKDVGTFKTEMHIKLVAGAQPFVQSVPRVVPIPLLKPFEKELERLQKLDIIEPIDTPTEWIAKNLIEKNDDIYLALLSYRTTPLECGLSPSELLYGRKLRTPLPVLPSRLDENINSNFSYTRKEGIAKDKSAKQFDKRHRTRKLSDLAIGNYVWVTDLRVYGKVIKILDEPRSYLIESINSGVYRRNRWHLVPAPYYSESTVTPRWAVPIDNNFKSAGMLPVNREPQVNIGTENIEDTVRQDTNSDVCAPNVSQEEQQDISASVSSPRPKRLIQKPTYLNDYILK